MIAVATTEDALTGVRDRLRSLGARSIDVVEPGGSRRVVLAFVDDERSVTGLVASLRADGLMAVTRPDRGAALQKWLQDTRPITFDGRLSVCRAWSEHDRQGLAGLIELGPGGFGDGRHPTTRLAIEVLLERIAGGERMLDVGCGSGILGLCALKLGAATVNRRRSTSRAPDAVELAAQRRNAGLNRMGAERMEAATLSPLGA